MAKLTTKIFDVLRQIVLGSIIVLFVYTLYKFVSKKVRSLTIPNSVQELTFLETDVIEFSQKANREPQDIKSDKTCDALMSGKLGPVVIMFYAPWCIHCKNMIPAFEEAAKLSNVPFVMIEGQHAPLSSKKYQIQGYPTIFGVKPGAPPERFAEQRTTSNLLLFASKTSPVVAYEEAQVAVAQAVAQAAVQAVPAQVGIQAQQVAVPAQVAVQAPESAVAPEIATEEHVV